MRGETMGVFDRIGNLNPCTRDQQGLFYRETRHLSKAILRLAETPLKLLSSAVSDDTRLLEIDLTNSEISSAGGETLPRSSLHIRRTKFLWNNACQELIEIHNYGSATFSTDLVLEFAADFADIFEVRGYKRRTRGRVLEPQLGLSSVTLSYAGLDGLLRTTKLQVNGLNARAAAGEMRIPIALAPRERTAFTITVACTAGENSNPLSYGDAAAELSSETTLYADCDIRASNEQFDTWLNRSKADLRMLTVATPQGPYPHAGLPWFNAVFGRDGIVTALECLWFLPELARGVLKFLAMTQATETESEKDSEPGKILHEAREGEAARTGEVPFRRYYGSVDATPLFLVLAAAYFTRTHDTEFMRSIWQNIQMALDWIDMFGDRDADGFVEYARFSSDGLVHQGWKDSNDSVFHCDGRLATGPIALCEVQGYVYSAKRGISAVAAELGYGEQSEKLAREADALRTRFCEAFWCEEIGTYALALDKEKRQCKVRTSNAGQCLFSGIADVEHARRITQSLLSEAFFSGWGIRTVATTEVRYNPMSYHNGSIWPHDNALISYGSLESENKELPCGILTGLFDAATFHYLYRLPELFCGFSRTARTGPAAYPLACAPQAWAAGAVFLVLQSCLGLSVNSAESTVYLTYPRLPDSIQKLTIRNLSIGRNSIDLDLVRIEQGVNVSIVRNTGNLQVRTNSLRARR